MWHHFRGGTEADYCTFFCPVVLPYLSFNLTIGVIMSKGPWLFLFSMQITKSTIMKVMTMPVDRTMQLGSCNLTGATMARQHFRYYFWSTQRWPDNIFVYYFWSTPFCWSQLVLIIFQTLLTHIKRLIIFQTGVHPHLFVLFPKNRILFFWLVNQNAWDWWYSVENLVHL